MNECSSTGDNKKHTIMQANKSFLVKLCFKIYNIMKFSWMEAISGMEYTFIIMHGIFADPSAQREHSDSYQNHVLDVFCL